MECMTFGYCMDLDLFDLNDHFGVIWELKELQIRWISEKKTQTKLQSGSETGEYVD